MPTKRTQEEFIELAKNKFGDKFSYDNVVYVNNTTPVEIFCNIHKRVFYSTPKHLLRMSLDSGCEECRKEILVNTGKHLKGRKYPNRKIYTTETFIEKANKIHNYKYDYSNVELIYVKNKIVTKYIKIICPEHGEFEQHYYSHLLGCGCPKCRNIKRRSCFSSNTEEFVKKSKELHGNKYDYSLVNYVNRNTPVKIICPIHGEFEQAPMHHLAGKGCFLCGKENHTNNENRTIEILKMKFPDLEIIQSYRNKEIFGRQHLDIYIPKLNIAIEYQGPQHFENVEYLIDFRHNYSHTHELDEIKFNKCKSLGIQLLYFTFNKKYENVKFFDKVYTNIDDIIKIINDKLNSNE